ncbi:hypothetical protein B0T26DRAFT_432797 [Lasiosphaeria miniovina]|uniref:Zn(2)-C6 fungal-type domain-containing protein n=1 Tax=Lasiosphaeria miniovina TaxID=1954250 RepID=A0AA40A6A4_9PEZI|nr:uncharacterized protein B0T26DRAFT_432797 [Lasiosphaeria miniovina]KAK0710109.1 hypothetical protein B0T26DRAFT_432797 [Lasiosphaeria miniovina]
MSHRHSCDRCRQQKVRCLQDESQSQGAGPGSNPAASRNRSSLTRCERCTKADVDCVYSLKQRSTRTSSGAQPATRRDANLDPSNANTGISSTSWFNQGLASVFSPAGGPIDLMVPFPGVDDASSSAGRGGLTGFHGWETIQPFSPISPPSTMAAQSGADAFGGAHDVRAISAGPSTPEDGGDDDDVADALSLQLTAISQRTTRSMRRLGRPGCAPLTVSSPEVNEAFEDTNNLIRIVNNIAAASSDRDDLPIDPATTDFGLVFLALASHQHLMALFRAICEAINRCLESMASENENQHQQQQQRSLHHGEVGPSSVAQFVMVLQLLMHLINRVDRSLFQVNKSLCFSSESSSGGQMTPDTPSMGSIHSSTIHALLMVGVGSAPQCLPTLAQAIARAIPDGHEKLRQVIQELQTKMEHSELQ